MTERRPSDDIWESEGAWGSLPRSPEPPCGCVPVRFNLERHCTENCTADCTTPAERCTENCTIDTIRLVGLRGGSGTSTIAAVLAMHAATMVNTELVSSDAAHMSALLGLGPHTGRPSEVMENLVLTNQPSTNGMMVIIDGGTLDPTQDSPGSKPGERRIGVLRGPCYLALRTLMAAPHGLDGLIVVSEFGRALNERDVADVTGLDVVATVAATPTVSRTIDAGLLTRRYRNLPDLRPLRRWLTLQLDPFPARPDPRRAAPNHPSMSGTDLPLPPGGERGCVRTAVLVDLSGSDPRDRSFHPALADTAVVDQPVLVQHLKRILKVLPPSLAEHRTIEFLETVNGTKRTPRSYGRRKVLSEVCSRSVG